MVFCAGEGFPSFASRESEIAFPHNVELKCNSDEVKVNLRGLKNRPGSTKPADITDLLRTKPPNYPNIVEMIYALTSKVRQINFFPHVFLCSISKSRLSCLQAKPTTQKFYLVVNLVQKKSIDSLVSEIQRGRTISKDQVLRESE
jgi:E3 SUMO-protein ligase PIAS1